MQQEVISTIEKSVGTSGLGLVYQDYLPGSDESFGWQRPKNSGVGIDNHIEVALPSADAPQGTEFVLIRDSDNPSRILAFRRDRFTQLCQGIMDGQYTIT